jgi:hypothetical protein
MSPSRLKVWAMSAIRSQITDTEIAGGGVGLVKIRNHPRDRTYAEASTIFLASRAEALRHAVICSQVKVKSYISITTRMCSTKFVKYRFYQYIMQLQRFTPLDKKNGAAISL